MPGGRREMHGWHNIILSPQYWLSEDFLTLKIVLAHGIFTKLYENKALKQMQNW